jgi:transcriptional regulator with XRE-family HTH domain
MIIEELSKKYEVSKFTRYITRATYYNLRAGERRVYNDTIILIAKVLNIDIVYVSLYFYALNNLYIIDTNEYKNILDKNDFSYLLDRQIKKAQYE